MPYNLMPRSAGGVFMRTTLAITMCRARGVPDRTEAASAVLDAAIATGRHRLWATVGAWNAASFRVLERLGFERHHSTWDDNGEVVWNMRELEREHGSS
jgi:Acetyltransferase (GNAT) domain